MTEHQEQYVLYTKSTKAKALSEYSIWTRFNLLGWLRNADTGKKGLQIGLDNVYLTSYVTPNLDKLAAQKRTQSREETNTQYSSNRMSHAETPPTSNLTSSSRGGHLDVFRGKNPIK